MAVENLDRIIHPVERISANVAEYFETKTHKIPIVERILPGSPKIFLLPGWCGVIDAEDPALDEYNELGYSVIQVGTPLPKEKRLVKDIVQRTLQRTRSLGEDADAFTELINTKTAIDENISIIGCSYGGLSAIEVANNIPEKIDHLMLINPAIRHKIDNVVALSARYTGNMGRTTFDAVREKGRDGFIGLVRTAGEAIGSPLDSMHRGYAIIHAEGTVVKAYEVAKNGVKITVVTGNGDGIFHGEKTRQQFKEGFIKEYRNDVSDDSVVFDVSLARIMPRFVAIDGGHDIGKTGREFAQFTIAEWQKTEDHFEKIVT